MVKYQRSSEKVRTKQDTEIRLYEVRKLIITRVISAFLCETPEEDDYSSNTESIYLGTNINPLLSAAHKRSPLVFDTAKSELIPLLQFVSAGFRRSMRLCRRRSHSTTQPSCHTRCPSSCYSALNSPYEEVVRYQRHPQDTHRLIALTGATKLTHSSFSNHFLSLENSICFLKV